MEYKKSGASPVDDLDSEGPRAVLISGAAQLGLWLSPAQIDQMMCYLRELLRWNQKINLTAVREEREIVVKHFLDSLTPLCILKPGKDARWIDVGSGAGFPALVLKIAVPDLRISLIEPVQKKAAFLHHLIGRLGMRYVSIINARIEEAIGASDRVDCDLLLTRALSPALVMDQGRTLVRAGGRMLFFQARSAQSDWENRLKPYPELELESHMPIGLPFSRAARTLVVLRLKEKALRS